ncbi:MAG: DUF1553 domain-containing protein [Zavarzinella sp.]
MVPEVQLLPNPTITWGDFLKTFHRFPRKLVLVNLPFLRYNPSFPTTHNRIKTMTKLFTLFALFTTMLAGTANVQAKEIPTYEGSVRPILKAFCFDCHGEESKPKGGLDLRLVRLMLVGGDNGPAIVPGKPEESELLARIVSKEMPPGKVKLNPQQIETIRTWLATGAKTAAPEPEKVGTGLLITPQDRAFWAYQPIKRPVVPTPHGHPQHPIDTLIENRLKKEGLTFSPEADRPTLIRRATFDLHGLPPTPQEVEAFIIDQSPDAYPKLIERLLASPRYGERWGRHWLDVAGYADSEGFAAEDSPRANAWKYRDYVIGAFNRDLPLNEFIKQQLAGDEMIQNSYASLTPQEKEYLVATGFLRMAPDGTGGRGVDQKEARNQVISDTIKVISTTFLGMTVACAQCHHHRYDPIPQEDYYRIRAILEPAYDLRTWKPPAARQVSLYSKEDIAKAAEIEKQAVAIDQDHSVKQQAAIEATFQKELAKLPKEIQPEALKARNTAADKRDAKQKDIMQKYPSLNVSAGSLYLYDKKAADELKKLTDQAAAIRAKKPKQEMIRALTEAPGNRPVTKLFHRGDPDQPKETIAPGGLTSLQDVLPLTVPARTDKQTSGRRMALANWLTDPRHPLTSRVWVNRVWYHHFGRGIVNSMGDFGMLGELPSHPELLDWLAAEFMQPSDKTNPAWSTKQLHRMIMNSRTYRQSSRRTDKLDKIDPDNKWYGRMNVRRLEAEAIRDSILAVSGALSLKMSGPPVPIRENDVGLIVVGKGVKDLARGTTKAEPMPPEEEFRRGIYITVRRTTPLTMHSAFDPPTLEPNCTGRITSTNAPAALVLLNDPFVEQQAALLAKRIETEVGKELPKHIQRAWQLAYGNLPTAPEQEMANKFLAEVSKTKTGPSPLTLLCWGLLNSNRFVYVD